MTFLRSGIKYIDSKDIYYFIILVSHQNCNFYFWQLSCKYFITGIHYIEDVTQAGLSKIQGLFKDL